MLCLHNSFGKNRDTRVDPLPCCKQKVEEQRCWRTASNSVRMATGASGGDGALTKSRKTILKKKKEQKNLELLELLNDEDQKKEMNKELT